MSRHASDWARLSEHLHTMAAMVPSDIQYDVQMTVPSYTGHPLRSRRFRGGLVQFERKGQAVRRGTSTP